MDESVWFDNFFYPVISPLFYVETLADLEKAVRQGRTPEQEVGYIAEKTPELSGRACAHHGSLCLANLMGSPVPMNGHIPVAGGRPVKTEGKKGVVLEATPEAQAFSRWQQGKFLEVERRYARTWRSALSDLDLLAVAAGIRAMGVGEKVCKSLDQAKSLTDSIVGIKDRPIDLLKLAFLFLGIPPQFERKILDKWAAEGYPPLSAFAPFAAYVLTVEVFFQIALGAHAL